MPSMLSRPRQSISVASSSKVSALRYFLAICLIVLMVVVDTNSVGTVAVAVAASL